MKVSLSWLKEYIDFDQTPEKISEILTAIGLEVEGEEEIESIKGGLEGVVVGHVTECGKHPGADRLSLTKVSIGAEEDLQIVCGAPNVAAGQKVLVATIGTTLYDKEGKPFKIKKGKMRGEVSQGMICAEDELGLGNAHDGIMVLPDDVKKGTLAKDYFNLETDVVFEIGLTPNRSDGTNHIGVAEDLAAALKINHGHSGKVKIPSVENFKVDSNDFQIPVEVQDSVACPRFTGLTISGIKVGPSPDWMQKRLTAVGVRPINNIVDITNFVLHEFGQPLHAYDADKIKGQKITVKTLPDGTIFKSLDEVDRKLNNADTIVCDGEGNGMCIAGIFGGANSGVTDGTTRIFLEAAHWNAKMIRRTSTRHLLFTDASKVFEKGSDPNVAAKALKRAALLIKEYAGGAFTSDVIDIYPNKIEPKQIEVNYNNVNTLIGSSLSKDEVKTILAAMDINVREEKLDSIVVEVPTNKSDVLREVDVIEEVLRIYGLNTVDVGRSIRSTITFADRPNKVQVKNRISDFLTGNGLFEMMGLSLTQSKYTKDLFPIDESKLVYVNNTSNSHLNIMRPVMLYSGLESILHNQNRQQNDVKLFEFGKTYLKDGDAYNETEHLTLWITGQNQPESWQNTKKAKVSYFALKTLVQNTLAKIGISNYQESAIQDETFAYGMKYHRGPQDLVSFGQIKNSLTNNMGIKKEVFYADFNWDLVLKSLKKSKIDYKSLTKFPTMRRDLALVLEKRVNFKEITSIAQKTGKGLITDINLFDVYENAKQLGEGKKSYAVSFIFENPEKTLSDKEVDKVMNQLIQLFETNLGATIRR